MILDTGTGKGNAHHVSCTVLSGIGHLLWSLKYSIEGMRSCPHMLLYCARRQRGTSSPASLFAQVMQPPAAARCSACSQCLSVAAAAVCQGHFAQPPLNVLHAQDGEGAIVDVRHVMSGFDPVWVLELNLEPVMDFVACQPAAWTPQDRHSLGVSLLVFSLHALVRALWLLPKRTCTLELQLQQ